MEESDTEMGEYERKAMERRAYVNVRIAKLEASLKMDVAQL